MRGRSMEPDKRSNPDAQANGLDQASIAELVQRLSEQSSTLARKEVELAKAEIAQKGKRLGHRSRRLRRRRGRWRCLPSER